MKLCGFPDLKCLYMESDLQKNELIHAKTSDFNFHMSGEI